MRRYWESLRTTLVIVWLLLPDWWQGIKAWAWRCLVWLDQGMNVVFGPLLNRIFSIDGFGNEDETLSSVLGKYRERCRLCRWLCWLLDRIDPGHCEKNIERDENRERAWTTQA